MKFAGEFLEMLGPALFLYGDLSEHTLVNETEIVVLSGLFEGIVPGRAGVDVWRKEPALCR